ncbi:zinc finger protein 729 [Stomoxys calcitrans]|uniref:zinc finger protein 729 n=1 Tax=Stomoxys calcitrans TaxID=35570 RepID=UPI0027E221E2|nr:zinc finger protein 729 [Stomoxys calcitrans]
MSQICRLCVNTCNDSKRLYDENGRVTELYDIVHNYFHPRILNLRQWRNLNSICMICWIRICDFHSFETTVTLAQLKLLDLDQNYAAEAGGGGCGGGEVEVGVGERMAVASSSHANQQVELLPLHAIKEEPPLVTNDWHSEVSQYSLDTDEPQIMTVVTQQQLQQSLIRPLHSGPNYELDNFPYLPEHQATRPVEEVLTLPNYPSLRNSLPKPVDIRERQIMVLDSSDDDDGEEEDSQDIKITSVMSLAHPIVFKPFESKEPPRVNRNEEVTEAHQANSNREERQLQANARVLITDCNISNNNNKQAQQQHKKEQQQQYRLESASLESDREFATPEPLESQPRLRKTQEDQNYIISQWRPTLKCELCSESFNLFSVFEEHFRFSHPKNICHVFCCDRKYVGAIEMRQHARKHLNPKSCVCDLCGKCFAQRSSLKKHMLTQHLRFKIPQGKMPMQRKRQKKRFKKKLAYTKKKISKNPLIRRKKNLSEDPEVIVPQSSEALEPLNNVLDDLMTQWQPLGIKCELCSKICGKYSLLSEHFLELHPQEACHIFCCGRRIFRSQLESHARKHLNPNVFYCDYCDSCFTQLSNLKRHIFNRHTKRKDCSKRREKPLAIEKNKPEKPAEVEQKQLSSARNIDDLIDKWKPILKCELCTEICPKFSHLEQHFIQAHSSQELFISCCKRKFSIRSKIERHAKHHLSASGKGGVRSHQNCEICSKSFSTRRGLLIHYNAMHFGHGGDEANHAQALALYNCKLCGKAYRDAKALYRHNWLMHKKDLKLKIIGRKLIQKVKTKRRKKIKKTNKRKKREVEDEEEDDSEDNLPLKKPKEKEQLNHQQAEAIDIEPEPEQREEEDEQPQFFECQKCPKKFITKKGLLIHISVKHLQAEDQKSSSALPEEDESNIENYECEKCSKKFLTRKGLLKHLSFKHLHNTVDESAVEEGQQQQSPSSLKENSADVSSLAENGDESVVAENEVYECEICHKKFFTNKGMIIHTKLKHLDAFRSSALYKCNLCDKTCRSARKLYLHKLKLHKLRLKINNGQVLKKNLKAPKMAESITPKSPIEEGLDNDNISKATPFNISDKHIGKKKWRQLFDDLVAKWRPQLHCELCSQACDNFSLLELHYQQQHIGETAYVMCCNRKFVSRTHLREHVMYHLQPSVFQCNVCGASCSSHGVLIQHQQKWHPEFVEFSHNCQLCGKTFETQKGLSTHMTVMHNGEISNKKSKYKCSICHRVYGTWESLWKHKRLVHKKDLKLKIVNGQVVKKRKMKNKIKKMEETEEEEEKEPQNSQQAPQSEDEEDTSWLVPETETVEPPFDNEFDDDHDLSTTSSTTNSVPYVGLKQWLENLDDLIIKWKPLLKCELCLESFPKFSQLQEHFQLQHGEEKFFMNCCNRKFLKRPRIRDHAMFHLDPSTFKCETCGLCFEARETLANHMNVKHPKVVDHPAYACAKCGKGFTTSKGALIHEALSHCHLMESPQAPNTGKSIIPNPSTAAAAAAAPLPPPLPAAAASPVATSPVLYPCKQCDKVYENYKSLYTHKYRIHNKPATSSATSSELETEASPREANFNKINTTPPPTPSPSAAASIDSTELHQCPHCDKSYTNSNSLAVHKWRCHRTTTVPGINRGTNESATQQPPLEQQPQQQQPLPEKQQQPPLFKCTECGKVCDTSKSLYSHVWYYHSHNEFKCKVCGKIFRRFAQLKEHSAVHTGKNAYGCMFCPKTFKYYTAVYLHRKKQHPHEMSKEYYRKLN